MFFFGITDIFKDYQRRYWPLFWYVVLDMDYGKVHGKRVYTPAAAAGPAGVELRLSSGGQKMPSLKAETASR